MTMTELCAELRNYFITDPDDIVTGTYEIASGSITPASFLAENDYFRIVGSRYNDGVYKNDSTTRGKFKAETFAGAIWRMAVPPEVVSLVSEISAWETATSEARNSPFQSESFGGYTYSLKSGGSSAPGGASALTWQGAFAERLKPYRRAVILI